MKPSKVTKLCLVIVGILLLKVSVSSGKPQINDYSYLYEDFEVQESQRTTRQLDPTLKIKFGQGISTGFAFARSKDGTYCNRDLMSLVKMICEKVQKQDRYRNRGGRRPIPFGNIRKYREKINRFAEICCHSKCEQSDEEEIELECRQRKFRNWFLTSLYKTYSTG